MGFDRAQADFIFNVANNRDPVSDILQTQFGVPECALNLAQDALSLLPTSPLQSINKSIEAGKQRAQDTIKEIKRRVFLELGLLEVTTDQGNMVIESATSNINSIVGGTGFLEGLNAAAEMFGAAAAVWGEVVTPILDKIDEVKGCLDQFKAHEALKSHNSVLAKDYVTVDEVDPDRLEAYEVDYSVKYAQERGDIINALGFISKAERMLNDINTILDNRFNNPEVFPEPCFNGDTVITQDNGAEIALKYLTSGTDFCVSDTASLIEAGKLPQESFRIQPIELDPPITKSGKFILTKTGIYYDTVGGGLEIPDNIEELVECSTIIPEDSLRWMFEYDPNCGGKGESVSLNYFNQWANTIFDIESTSDIDTDSSLIPYYDKDTFLQQIYGERNRQLYDLSSYIGDLVTSGYANDSALVNNQRQQLQAANARHENKLKRRKKQIQVAVIFGEFPVGEIPINDFSFLDILDVTIPVENQQRLVFNPGEVSSVVLPVNTKFSITKEKAIGDVYLNHLTVPSIGAGAIISSASSVSATDHPAILSLTDNITTKDLIACYNFLNGAVETNPASFKFKVTNSADKNNNRYNAQIVANSFDTVFPSGVGIAQFKGVCSFFSGTEGGFEGNSKASYWGAAPQYLQAPYKPLSYMRLPNNVDDFESLLYRNSGFTFETWVHMPTLASETADGWDTSVGASSLHRIILANENRGGSKRVANTEGFAFNRDLDSVGSLLMGFTRDRRFTKNKPPSNVPADNPIDQDLKFYLAPVTSVNTSGITFIPRGSIDCTYQEPTGQRYLGIVADASAQDSTSTVRLMDCSSSFKLVTVTADPEDDGVVTIYCNGLKIKSQDFTQTFGMKGPPQLPTPIDASAYTYASVYNGTLPPNPVTYITSAVYEKDFWNWNGPTMPTFTPWMVGGGFSDGMTNIDLGYDYTSSAGMNFMGGSDGGLRSGLNGFLGSVKLYKRALDSSEVLTNYKAQKGFFENIELYGDF